MATRDSLLRTRQHENFLELRFARMPKFPPSSAFQTESCVACILSDCTKPDLCWDSFKSFAELVYFFLRIQGQGRQDVRHHLQGFTEDETLLTMLRFQGSRHRISLGKTPIFFAPNDVQWQSVLPASTSAPAASRVSLVSLSSPSLTQRMSGVVSRQSAHTTSAGQSLSITPPHPPVVSLGTPVTAHVWSYQPDDEATWLSGRWPMAKDFLWKEMSVK